MIDIYTLITIKCLNFTNYAFFLWVWIQSIALFAAVMLSKECLQIKRTPCRLWITVEADIIFTKWAAAPAAAVRTANYSRAMRPLQLTQYNSSGIHCTHSLGSSSYSAVTAVDRRESKASCDKWPCFRAGVSETRSVVIKRTLREKASIAEHGRHGLLEIRGPALCYHHCGSVDTAVRALCCREPITMARARVVYLQSRPARSPYDTTWYHVVVKKKQFL